jgi:hypothetical protein
LPIHFGHKLLPIIRFCSHCFAVVRIFPHFSPALCAALWFARSRAI